MKRVLIAAALLTLAAAPPPRAREHAVERLERQISVVVNGQAVELHPGPRVVDGRVLVPARGIFAALALDVVASGTNREGRPAKTLHVALPSGDLVLSVGSDRADFDGRAIAFSPAVSEINGTVYVPLHFIEVAFGAQVNYDGRDSKIEIISALVGRVPIAPGGKGAPLTGIVTAVDTLSSPPSVTITYHGSARTIALTSNAKVTVEDVSAHTRMNGTLDDVRPGDVLAAFLAQNGTVSDLIDTFASRTGMIAAVSPSAIVLGDGHVYSPGRATVISLNGEKAQLSDLHDGDAVVVRSNPESAEIREIIASRKSSETAPPPSTVEIASFSISATRPLKAGESFDIDLTGTPAGRATFDIGTYLSGLPLKEVSAGRYHATFEIPPAANFTQIPVYGQLAVGKVEAARAQATVQLSASTLPPRIVDIAPSNRQVVNNPKPSIYATFETPTDIGINRSSIALVVNGQDETAAAVRGANFVTYDPGVSYPDGTVNVTVRVADLAGNIASRSWQFTIRSR